jgi:hypothetical protein
MYIIATPLTGEYYGAFTALDKHELVQRKETTA